MKLTKKEKQILYRAAIKVSLNPLSYKYSRFSCNAIDRVHSCVENTKLRQSYSKFYEFSYNINKDGFLHTPDFPTDLQLFRSLLLLLFRKVGETL